MNDKVVTTDVIINWFKHAVENKEIIEPSRWIDGAQKLNALLADEHDLLWNVQQKVAQAKVALLNSEEKRNVSAVKVLIEATDEYKSLQLQKSKISRIEEFIRIAKIQARLKDTE